MCVSLFLDLVVKKFEAGFGKENEGRGSFKGN